MADQFAWYLEALKGRRGDFDPRNPPSGYYRHRDRSLALWREGDAVHWMVSSGFRPRDMDGLCEAFASFCVTPISYEVWEAHGQTGRWPEDPSAEIEAARAPGIGHNQPPPEMAILDELAAIRRAFDGWLLSIGGTIASEDHDAKVKEYTNRVADLKKKAVEAHRVDKEPHLRAGRECDDRWRIAKDKTDAEQRAIAAVATAYRLDREEKRKEAERLAREAAIEARRKAMSVNAPPPVAQMPRKAASGLRTVKGVVIDDLPALVSWLAAQSPAEPKLIEAARVAARIYLERGEDVPGARLNVERIAA